MTLEEKNNKLFDLNSKIALYKTTIKSLQKDIINTAYKEITKQKFKVMLLAAQK